MTVLVDAAGPLPRGRAAGRLIAAAGAAITLASMFLPWYSVSLRIKSYADLATFANAHVGGAHLVCDPPAGAGCHLSAQVGALTQGIGDWRTLIAVSAAAVLLSVVLRATRPGRAGGGWRLLTVLAAVTSGLAVAAVLVGPVGPAPAAGLLGSRIDLASSASFGVFVAVAGAMLALAGALLSGPWGRAVARS
ncbi:MAG TPA: hypothetical protein VF843_11110 [Streptosporangiaceae bacterium]